MSILHCNPALASLAERHLPALAAAEGLSAETLHEAVDKGRAVLLGNPAHPGLAPICVGRPARVKVNANLGVSSRRNHPECEFRKLAVALAAGADTVMDLSVGGDLDAIRQEMLARCPAPLGTVPLYAVAQQRIAAGGDPADFSADELFGEISRQAGQGVDFMTVHCGVTRRGMEFATGGDRVMGVVSRGGSITARWMRRTGRENPLLEEFDRLLDIAREHNVTLSLGDALRPGAGCDAGDAAQWEEVMVLGELVARSRAAGVQCMVEGPGHVPLHEVDWQVRGIKRLTLDAPLYVLGPLVIDSCPGHDHLAGAIGAAVAVQSGVDFLCYLTPAEHLTLPGVEDVRQGVLASRIAAQAGEVALGRPQAVAREMAMSRARAALDWEAMAGLSLDPDTVRSRRADQPGEETCAMCGEFCAVKMLRR